MEDNKTPRNSRRKCSFCGRSENEVGFLITGMNGCICDSCSEQAYEIIQEAMHQKKDAPGELNLKELPKPKEIKDFLDQYIIGQDAAKRYLSVAVYNQPILLNKVYIGTPHIAGYSADGKVNADNMVIDALCDFFDIKHPNTIVPPTLPSDFVYTGNPLQLYDPLADSERLKQNIEKFEDLRGNYPLRREFYAQ